MCVAAIPYCHVITEFGILANKRPTLGQQQHTREICIVFSAITLDIAYETILPDYSTLSLLLDIDHFLT